MFRYLSIPHFRIQGEEQELDREPLLLFQFLILGYPNHIHLSSFYKVLSIPHFRILKKRKFIEPVAVFFQFLILGYTFKSRLNFNPLSLFQFLILGYVTSAVLVLLETLPFQFLILGYDMGYLAGKLVQENLSIPHFRIPTHLATLSSPVYPTFNSSF